MKLLIPTILIILILISFRCQKRKEHFQNTNNLSEDEKIEGILKVINAGLQQINLKYVKDIYDAENNLNLLIKIPDNIQTIINIANLKSNKQIKTEYSEILEEMKITFENIAIEISKDTPNDNILQQKITI